MPTQGQRLRGARDLLLVAGVAAFVVGLTAVGAGLGGPEREARSNASLARTAAATEDAPNAIDRQHHSSPRGGLTASPRQDGPVRDVTPRCDLATPGDAGQTCPIPDEPAARRTFLQGSAAVAHRRILVRSYQATPPAAELAALASSSGRP